MRDIQPVFFLIVLVHSINDKNQVCVSGMRTKTNSQAAFVQRICLHRHQRLPNSISGCGNVNLRMPINFNGPPSAEII